MTDPGASGGAVPAYDAGGGGPRPPGEKDAQSPTTDELRAQAIGEYERALQESPDNLVVALRLAGLLERQHDYHRALAIYARASVRWPRVFEPQYRLAATLGMSDAWAPRGATSGAAERALESFPRSAPWSKLAADLRKPDTAIVRSNLEIAVGRWASLQQFMAFLPSVRRWLSAILTPTGRRELRDAPYQRRFASLGRRARARRRSVQIAAACSDVQSLCPAPGPLTDEHDRTVDALRAKVKRLLAAGRATSDSLYNGACWYSRAYELTGKADYVETALDLLQRAVAADEGRRALLILDRDPDLAPLRRTRAFGNWESGVRIGERRDATIRWTIGVSCAFVTWWSLWQDVVNRPDSDKESYHKADDDAFAAFTAWADPNGAAQEEGLPANAILTAAAAMHVRLDRPPSSKLLDKDEFAALKAFKINGISAFDVGGDARLQRWEILTGALNTIADRRTGRV